MPLASAPVRLNRLPMRFHRPIAAATRTDHTARSIVEPLEARRLLAAVTVTNQGPAYDNFGDITFGWTGYLLQLTADPGQVITAVDLGLNSASSNGIFGQMLQNWRSSKSGPLATAVGSSASDSNGQDNGTDSHVLATSRLDFQAPVENNDQVNPFGAPSNGGGETWGTGSYLRGIFGISAGSQANSIALAYLVLKDGTAGSYVLNVAQAVPGQGSTTVALAGAFPTGSISGTIFNDQNGNAIRDGGESALVGWGCFLDFNANGAFDDGDVRTLADSSGECRFGNLTAGVYYISQMTPARWLRTVPGGSTHTVTLTSGQNSSGNDFGVVQAGAISGQMYHDQNADGVKQAGEAVLVGWGCFLDFNANGAFDPGDLRVLSDPAGNYQFGNLAAGVYHVSQMTPPGWLRTIPLGSSYAVTLSAGQSAGGKDFAVVQAGTISGRTYNDRNGDGANQSGEPGMLGWGCFLDFNNDGTFNGPDVRVLSDAAGNYAFTNLLPGSYRIRQNPPASWRRTVPTSIHTVDLTAGQNASGKDFGETQAVLISGSVFNDSNNSQSRNTGEGELSGWRVFIDSNNDSAWQNTEASMLTDGSGDWTFKGQSAKSFVVRLVLQSGWTQTTPSAGFSFTLSSGKTRTGLLFGERQIA